MLPPVRRKLPLRCRYGAERRFGTSDRRVISMPGSAGRHHCSLLLNLTAGKWSRSDDRTSRPAFLSAGSYFTKIIPASRYSLAIAPGEAA